MAATQLVFSTKAWEEYLYWQGTDEKQVRRINQLIKEVMREPFSGIGKPEPLRHALQGYWSRRIDSEHRLVYKVVDEQLWVAQVRFHYRD
ncbi:MAG: Txe/YoeB family addiction module toxin [Opitutaceae bacterium]|jgi:toxin YoeB|nr:Txe/YoeB family addiction module toxin [Opitutaceae bacterium]